MASNPQEDAFMVFFHASEAVFSMWTGLRLAMDGGWGGADSDDKAMAMFETVMGQFHAGMTGKSRVPDRDDLSDFLFKELDRELSVQMEDGSCDAVAAELCAMFAEVAAGDQTRAMTRISQMRAPSNALGHSVEGAVAEEEEAQFSDGDEGEEMEVVPTGPDADGWETVPVKKGRRRG